MFIFNKLMFLVIFVIFVNETLIAGGIVTNTNQSAAYSRMLVRDASTDIDAVYYNPAALTLLPDGMFISINNQSIFQTREVTNDYAYLNDSKFEGTASAPLFPGVYAGYKTGDFVFSLGFNPVGGGGSAEWNKGLPSFQLPIADLVPSLGGPQNATYSTDIYFKGSSVYWGIQGGLSYKITDMISVFAGARYIMAQNSYSGHLKGTSITTKMPSAYSGRADTYLQGVAQLYRGVEAQFRNAGQLDSAIKYDGLATGYENNAKLLNDQEAEAEQTGSGITPIIGFNFNLLDNKLNIGLKYEMNTGLKLKNKTSKDFALKYNIMLSGTDIVTVDSTTQFPDGKEINADIPALLSLGASYKITNELSAALGFHYYFDKNANWDGMQDSLDGNSYEFGIGLEYMVTDNILFSAGFLNTGNGAGNSYLTDMSYTLQSNSIALGGKYKLMDQLSVNIGFIQTFNKVGNKENMHNIAGTGAFAPANYTFDKSTTVIAIGIDWYLFGGM